MYIRYIHREAKATRKKKGEGKFLFLTGEVSTVPLADQPQLLESAVPELRDVPLLLAAGGPLRVGDGLESLEAHAVQVAEERRHREEGRAGLRLGGDLVLTAGTRLQSHNQCMKTCLLLLHGGNFPLEGVHVSQHGVPV